MYQKNPNLYLKNQVMSASPNKLIEMLLEGGIKNIRLGILALEKEQLVKASEYLLKAQDIVSELRYSINTEIDSEIPQQLIQLYDFMYSQLVIGNIDQDIKVLQEVQKLLTELLETWKEISVAG
ncbi:flagellar export chaperone FliS [Enterococcus lemanii]|uniref:Flagellar export chaperone FliS n=1 Tax=Enterococcus lemanii TaxID=1159752 RepID=A0ABV9MZJ8_9ENTE|nr:flagellar export chaperone FliS [Enterococcus lemanii]MBM7708097.1 flagellar protein FliS [Enterococcus lemanii]